MGCGSCGSGGGCGTTGGCKSTGCATGGCNKLNTYDWLNNMLGPDQTEVDNIYEIRFKSTRKAFYRNINGLRLHIGDYVVVESDRGFDVGTLSLGGMLAELQMRKRGQKKSDRDIPRIYRKANEADVASLKLARSREKETLARTRELIREQNLNMKLSEVEFQGDNAKATFYYIADHRVDFRELIKVLAREFHIRVEMKQIGLRHEAGLVGGIGSCGRELCCSTWLTEFRTVNTSAARYQNLSLNPMKISGQCGRLKCCLNFELDSYLDALQNFPEVNRIETIKGRAFLQKTDIFKNIMWFSYDNETTWFALDAEQVHRVIDANKRGEKPEVQAAGTVLAMESMGGSAESALDFVDVVGTDVPTEEETRNRSRRKKKKKVLRAPDNRAQGATAQPQQERRSDGPPRDNRPDNRPPRNEQQNREQRQQRPPRDPNQPPRSEQQNREQGQQRPPRDPNQPPRGEQRPREQGEQRPPRDPNQRPPQQRQQRPPQGQQQGPPQPRDPNLPEGQGDTRPPRRKSKKKRRPGGGPRPNNSNNPPAA